MDIWIDIFQWVDVKKVVSLVNAHQKLTSAKEELNNRVGEMDDPFCGSSQHLFLGIPVIVQCT